MSRPKRPKDPNKLAKLIVDIATGEIEAVDLDKDKDPAAVSLGRKGGKKGRKARANPFLQNDVRNSYKSSKIAMEDKNYFKNSN